MRTLIYLIFFLFFIANQTLGQTDSIKTKGIVIQSKNLVFYGPQKNIISPNDYMELANSGLYKISYEKHEDSIISYLDSSMLLKSINHPFRNSEIKNIQGKPFVLPKNKVIIVNFWNTGCKPCFDEIDSLNLLVKKYPKVFFLGITQDSLSAINLLMKKKPFNYKIGMLSFEKIKSQYHVTAAPTHILIDKKGIIREIYVGKNDIYTIIYNFLGNNTTKML